MDSNEVIENLYMNDKGLAVLVQITSKYVLEQIANVNKTGVFYLDSSEYKSLSKRTLRDPSDELFYPITDTDAVYDSEGVLLSTIIENTNTSINNIKKDYLKLSGGTMTGGIIMPTGSTSSNNLGILFGNVAKIGANSNGALGIYASNNIFIRPGLDDTMNTNEGIIISTSSVIPSNNDTMNLGISSNKWLAVYATTFYGTLSGNATSATNDGDGNKISSTYLKLSGGTLNKGSSIIVEGDSDNRKAEFYGSGVKLTTPTGGWATGLNYFNTSDNSIGAIGAYGQANDLIYFYIGKAYNDNAFQITPAGVATFKDNVTAPTFIGNLSGNATSATKLATARTISLTGSITGSGTFDGSGNLNITTTTNHNHDTSYLKLSGGTMTGNIAFSAVTSTSYPAGSNGLTWSGSTDGASIYYRVNASDAGRLVLNLIDDSNTYICFALNGTDFATISTSGHFSGSSASATKATQDSDGNTIKSTYLKLSGGTMTGDLTISAKIQLNRKSSTNYGRISFYDSSYYTWYEYMNNIAASPTGANSPSYGSVTSWARRSLIENNSGYGWIWESCSNTVNAAPVGMMALSSNTGNLTVKGTVTAASFSGNATSATKLATARKINDISFDGTSDIYLSSGRRWWVGTDVANSAGWYLFMEKTMAQYHDFNMTLAVTSEYSSRLHGMLNIHVRCDSTTTSGTPTLRWMYRKGWDAGHIIAVVSGLKVSFYAYLTPTQWGRICFQVVSESSRGSGTAYTIKSSTSPTTGLTATSTSSDGATVGTASVATKLSNTAAIGSATQPVYFNASGVPVACTYTLGKSVPSNAVFTDTTYSNFVKSGSGAKAGLVPAPSTTAGTTKYLREDGTWQVPPNTTYTLSSITGTLAVSKGGTGATTFTSGAALIGNGTGAVTTRAITNMTTKNYITYNTNLMTTNTLAYWNGAYASNGGSNLTYCTKGAFGTAATAGLTTSLASTSTTTALAASAGKSLQDQLSVLNTWNSYIKPISKRNVGYNEGAVEYLTSNVPYLIITHSWTTGDAFGVYMYMPTAGCNVSVIKNDPNVQISVNSSNPHIVTIWYRTNNGSMMCWLYELVR